MVEWNKILPLFVVVEGGLLAYFYRTYPTSALYDHPE